VIESSSKGLFSFITESGLLKKDVLELDVARLSAFYHNHGYIEAKVGEPEIVQEGKWLYITFNIFEGDRYRVGSVDISGDLIVDKNDLLALVELREEEYLSRQILREDILRITDFYAENGFAFAEVNPAIKENQAEKTVDIAIDIIKGDLVYLNRIMIKGNTRTRDKVIRRELAIKEKDVFNSKAMRTSHEAVQRLDYFEEININPEATLVGNLMDVIVEVKEKPTGAFSVGAGYSSAESFMFMGEISQNNFLGKGQRLALAANLSGTSSRYNLSFTEPRYKDSKLLVGLDLYNWQREYDDYTKDSTGGAIRFGYPVWGKWYMGFGYGYDNADLTDIQETASSVIKDSAGIHVTSFVTLNFTRDTRNRRYNATKGSRNVIASKLAGGYLQGDAAFTKVEGTSSWYFPLFWETSFHLKGAAGQVFENTSGQLPVFEKFYLGGLGSVRGFPANNISPVDPVTGDRIGGTKMWYTNLEWLFPVLKDAGLSGVVFFDAGNAFDEWSFEIIKKSVGGGLRWLSPMGPLRLEYGFVIDPEPDEDSGNWEFSIGTEF
jgi:outer membrane protein insertion porin family